CRPVPGDPILGYLGGQGLIVHHAQCHNVIKLREKDAERFITVDWADDVTRLFESGIVVTVQNNKGVLARVAAELSNAEADIVRVEMTDEAAMGTTDLCFVIAVNNAQQVENALRNLRRVHSVLRASRIIA
ncbi:MAG: ACT domain-containing protein, partial [Comamonas sp.]